MLFSVLQFTFLKALYCVTHEKTLLWIKYHNVDMKRETNRTQYEKEDTKTNIFQMH